MSIHFHPKPIFFLEYTMSPSQVDHFLHKMNNFLHQSGASPEPNHYRSASQVPLFPGQNKKQGKKQGGQLFYPFKENIII